MCRTFLVPLFLIAPIANRNFLAMDPNPNAVSSRWLGAVPRTPSLAIPASAEGWPSQRDGIRSRLRALLGDIPPRPTTPTATLLWTEERGSYRLEKFEFDNGAGEIVRGYLFVPKGATPQKRAPAVLYCHWHGGQYDIGKEELLSTYATPVAPGPELAEQGYVVLGIDACGFGERNGAGPDGPSQRGSAGEMTAAKFNLWVGRTLWGMMVRDDLIALDILAARPEVDAGRIGVTGISMGSTRTWWLMALDDRPRTGVAVACMTRYRDLMEAGMLKAHGIYYFVPGMLQHFDSETVIACAAPRPMLFMTGDQDSGSPVEGVRTIGANVSRLYEALGHGADGSFESRIFEGVGHVYLPEMWQATQAWFERHLKSAR